MAESDLNKRICAALADLDPRRVENTVGSGTPDINWRDGWIEDKQVRFPKDENLIIKVEHYTAQQRAWHVKRRRAGGLVHVVIDDSRTGRTYAFDGLVAARGLGTWTEIEMQVYASLFQRRWDGNEFRKWLLSCKP